MVAKTALVKNLLGRTVKTTNGNRWKITKYQNRNLIGSSDTHYTTKYFMCKRVGGTSYSRTISQRTYLVLADFSYKPELFREQIALSQLGNLSRQTAYIKKEQIPYLGIPTLVGLGTDEVYNVSYRFVITGTRDLKQYHTIGYSDQLLPLVRARKVCTACLDVLGFMSSMHLWHGRIRPNNLVYTLNVPKNNEQIMVLDYSTTKKVSLKVSTESVEAEKEVRSAEDLLFQSIDQHMHIDQSHRGDLESLGYTLAFCLVGELPWRADMAQRTVLKLKLKYKEAKNLWHGWWVRKYTGSVGTLYWLTKLLRYSYLLDYNSVPKYQALKCKLQLPHTDEGGYMPYCKSTTGNLYQSDSDSDSDSTSSDEDTEGNSDVDLVSILTSDGDINKLNTTVIIPTYGSLLRADRQSPIAGISVPTSMHHSAKKRKKTVHFKLPESLQLTGPTMSSRNHLKSILKSSILRQRS